MGDPDPGVAQLIAQRLGERAEPGARAAAERNLAPVVVIPMPSLSWDCLVSASGSVG